MSVIENPVAYLNETSDEVHDKQTPPMKPAEVPKADACDILDDTPLTSNNKARCPKRLSQSPDKAHDLPPEQNTEESTRQATDVYGTCQLAETFDGPRDVENEKVETSKDHKDASPEEQQDESSASAEPVNLLAWLRSWLLTNQGTRNMSRGGPRGRGRRERRSPEEEEEEGEIQRQYSLRGGVKGTVVEEVKEVSHDTTDKKKAEDLWSTFKADVAMPIKRNAAKIASAAKETVYDFAGETVTVKEEIKSKRKSIVSSLGLNRKRRRESAPCMSRTKSSDSQVSSSVTSEEALTEVPSEAPSEVPSEVPSEAPTESRGGVKRPRPVSKLGTIVNRLTKRPKMTVLDKTALDWEQYKDNKSITDAVKQEAVTEGYLEKQDFLTRADERQFELEKEIRLQQQRRRQMMGSKQF